MATPKRAIAKFSVVVDQTDKPYGPVGAPVLIRATVYLYRESGAYVWRIGGPMGDRVDTLPIAGTVAQAKRDARAVYDCPAWQMQDAWL